MTVEEMKYLDLVGKLKDLELDYLKLKVEKEYLSCNHPSPRDINEAIRYKVVEKVVQTKYSGTQIIRFVAPV